MVTKKKVIEIEVTQKMCDELNELQEKLFGNLNEENRKSMEEMEEYEFF